MPRLSDFRLTRQSKPAGSCRFEGSCAAASGQPAAATDGALPEKQLSSKLSRVKCVSFVTTSGISVYRAQLPEPATPHQLKLLQPTGDYGII